VLPHFEQGSATHGRAFSSNAVFLNLFSVRDPLWYFYTLCDPLLLVFNTYDIITIMIQNAILEKCNKLPHFYHKNTFHNI